MKAWRFYAFGDMRLDEVELGDCPPDRVLIEPIVVQPSVTEAPLQLFGHEFCARILAVGSEVRGYEPGDWVAARPMGRGG